MTTSPDHIQAVIFDMDGLLIDSEPYWRTAMIAGFAEVGLHLTDEMCAVTQGYRIDEVVEIWYQRHPWSGPDVAAVTQWIVEEVERLVRTQGQPLPGVYKLFDFLEARNIRLSLASSSHLSLIEATIDKLDLRKRLELWHSAELEDYGKPHPQVFITTANKLGVDPSRCLVFEDSLHGVIAGKAAKMKVVAVPEAANWERPQFAVADLNLRSLTEFDEAVWTSLQH